MDTRARRCDVRIGLSRFHVNIIYPSWVAPVYISCILLGADNFTRVRYRFTPQIGDEELPVSIRGARLDGSILGELAVSV